MKKIVDILKDIRPEFDFTQSEDFIGDGYLDSFDLVTLVATMEKAYGIKIKGTDIVPEHFCSLAAIGQMLEVYGVNDAV